MTRVTYIEFNGTQHDIEANDGLTLMKVAVNNDINGIVAECGGACACATCHVYVDEQWLAKLPPMDNTEHDMLDFAAGVQANSRLSCQIKVSAGLDGIVVRMPDSQFS
ncbi:2Fe-2S iron-sulfur cluster-binding protein [Pseudomonas putida]